MALCKGIPNKWINIWQLLLRSPQLSQELQLVARPLHYQNHQLLLKQCRRPEQYLKPPPHPPDCASGRWRLLALLPDRQIYQEWGRHIWCNSEHRHIENIYRKSGSLITLSTHDGISIANTSAVVFSEFCSCCSILFMYAKINGNILPWEGDNGIFYRLWKDSEPYFPEWM